MIAMQLILKLQCLQTFCTQTIGVLRFNKYTLFVTECYRAALAFCNIANFAFKGFVTPRTRFAFMSRHGCYQLKVTPALNRKGILLNPLTSKNFLLPMF